MFEKMKGLTPKKKIEYFLMYYGWATVLIIVAIVFVVSMIVNACRAKDTIGGLIVVNAYEDLSDEAGTEVEDYLAEVAENNGFDTKKEKIDLNTGIYCGDQYDYQSNYAGSMKIQTLLTTSSADIIVFDDQYTTFTSFFDALGDIREYMTDDLIEANKDNFLYYTPTQEEVDDGYVDSLEPYPVAVKINPNSKLEKISGYYPKNNGYIGVCLKVISSKEMVKEIVLDALQ